MNVTGFRALEKLAHMRAAARRWEEKAADRSAYQATPQQESRFEVRQNLIGKAVEMRRSGLLPSRLERRIGPTLDLVSLPPSEAARKAGRPVARIVQQASENVVPFGFATGFLVAPNLLLTNHHVFPDASFVTGTKANFLYEESERGIETGALFEFDPAAFFFADENLDFALVGMKAGLSNGVHLEEMGRILLIEATSKTLPGLGINIIQYPKGGQKEYAFTNNRLVSLLDSGFLQYETDTEEGSSGSPLFSESWELIGLHHAGVPKMENDLPVTITGAPWTEDTPDDQIVWVANEGVRVSAIVKCLASSRMSDAGQQAILKDLLRDTTDPVDDVAKEMLRPSTPPPTLDASTALTGGFPAMNPTTYFHFTGPVTINVYGGAAVVSETPAITTQTETPALEKSITFDPDRTYANRDGYDPAFLGSDKVVPLPGIAEERMDEILLDGDKPLVLKYHHYSIVMNKLRRLQMFSAVNVDYDESVRDTRGRQELGTDRWIPDPRVPPQFQIQDPDFYKPATKVDRGHIVRREDNAWGASDLEREYANSDTFHWTNCTPQHEAFNRSSLAGLPQYQGMSGLWGSFENHVKSELVKSEDRRACILAGPVLDNIHDPVAKFNGGQLPYPIRFWKVVVVLEKDGNLKAYGFVFSQKDVVDRFGIEEFRPGKFEANGRALSEITLLTGVTFADSLYAADTLAS